MNVTMKDRVALVTGGSKGLGLAMARRFPESGARVAIVARGAEGLAAAPHGARQGWPQYSRLRLRRLQSGGYFEHL
jgi:NAD(P)-dependent dehydrogenase (short-subunit alcohol dehydrogenase family)